MSWPAAGCSPELVGEGEGEGEGGAQVGDGNQQVEHRVYQQIHHTQIYDIAGKNTYEKPDTVRAVARELRVLSVISTVSLRYRNLALLSL